MPESNSIPNNKTRHRRGGKPAGPFSADHVLSTLDRRTRAGRVMRTVEADLVAHIGGDPSAAERLLIQAVAVKATRLSLMAEQLLAGEGSAEGSDGNALAWFNSMRLDLQALGLQRRPRDVSSLAAYIRSAKTGEAP